MFLVSGLEIVSIGSLQTVSI